MGGRAPGLMHLFCSTIAIPKRSEGPAVSSFLEEADSSGPAVRNDNSPQRAWPVRLRDRPISFISGELIIK
jgi:hypothetical protein